MAPIKMIQLTNKNQSPLSEEVKLRMIDREMAHQRFIDSNRMEDLREYRNIKNLVNRQIAKDRFKRNMASYQGEATKTSDKWRKVKKDTGQARYTSPQTIVENNTNHTKHWYGQCTQQRVHSNCQKTDH